MISPEPGSYVLEAVMSQAEGAMVHLVNEDHDITEKLVQLGQIWIQAATGGAPPRPFLLIEIED